ncbi:hypothetical protein [Actinosynnema sp. NPDC020468]|uniref:hypothetical protein n=1 Tax=Actinosynnema sp. NPDC020468 TaxID=3154488 RepID=UPI0033CDC20E
MTLPFPLLDDPAALARLECWTEPVYRDLIALERGELELSDFRSRYVRRRAVLVLDITGFTEASARGAEAAFLRILHVQRVAGAVFRDGGAVLVRAFADDLVALFDSPAAAVEAAFEAHRRVAVANAVLDVPDAPSCCVGIGYGDVYAIGPNLAMGHEMNLASKLGEDTACAGETLLTCAAHAAVSAVGSAVGSADARTSFEWRSTPGLPRYVAARR